MELEGSKAMDDTRYMKLAAYGRSRGISYKILRQLLAAGKLAAGRIGSRYFVDTERCDAFFAKITTPREEQLPSIPSRRRGNYQKDIRARIAEVRQMLKEGKCTWNAAQ